MSTRRLFSIAAASLVLAACNPFHHEPVVQVNTGDVNLNSRWHGTLASPARLSGAVQVKGAVTMSPGSSPSTTVVTMNVSNAASGGLHPWEVRGGHCGSPAGVFGSAGDYEPISIDSDGRGSSTATVSQASPTAGAYSAIVYAAPDNPETVIACANLAPPTP
jgi:hypothetical protein